MSMRSPAAVRIKNGAVLIKGMERYQAGVGLIEVLIAVLILSIAFLGIAALQATSLSTNNSAMARSMATIASYSILDAMRTDVNAATGTTYNTTVKASACPDGTGSLANYQLNAWCTQLGNTFGAVESTQGTVACDALGNCKVTISFDDSRAGAGIKGTQTVVTQAIL
jgi:type IV pilus assembly protein PilV